MRIRTIKPDFWLHEGLAQLSAMHRLLFIGLWQLADREGRLEDRPKRIAAALFPYEPGVDVDRMLGDLDDEGLVHRYGADLLAIPGFREHQRPHPKEAASLHPEPPSREKKRRAVESREGRSSVPSTPVGREGKGREGVSGREGNPAGEKPPAPSGAHQDAVDRIWATWKRTKACDYVPAPRGADFKAVKELLAAGQTPEAIEAAWARALAHVGYPSVSNVVELQQHFGKFNGAGMAKPGTPAPLEQHTKTGRLEL